jgi:hypothetical protein
MNDETITDLMQTMGRKQKAASSQIERAQEAIQSVALLGLIETDNFKTDYLTCLAVMP